MSFGNRLVVKPILSINELKISNSISFIWYHLIVQVFIDWLLPFFNDLFGHDPIIFMISLLKVSFLWIPCVCFCFWSWKIISNFHGWGLFNLRVSSHICRTAVPKGGLYCRCFGCWAHFLLVLKLFLWILQSRLYIRGLRLVIVRSFSAHTI